MTARQAVGMLAAAWALAACAPEGGELREATERRRAQARDDTTTTTVEADTPAARPDPGDAPEIPALLENVPPPVDAPPAQTPAGEQPLGTWTDDDTEVENDLPGLAVLRDVRAGRNAGFDRVVLEFADGRVPSYEVEYVDRPVEACGSGERTQIAGQRWLRIRLRGTQAHDDAGRATVAVRERRLNMPVVQEWEITCDFEGEVEVVLGVSSPNPYRVTEVPGPARLVVDVQQ